MRERAALLDGFFEAGPEPGPEGTLWVVRATLPVTDVEQGEA
jgi:hypothetical protein